MVNATPNFSALNSGKVFHEIIISVYDVKDKPSTITASRYGHLHHLFLLYKR